MPRIFNSKKSPQWTKMSIHWRGQFVAIFLGGYSHKKNGQRGRTMSSTPPSQKIWKTGNRCKQLKVVQPHKRQNRNEAGQQQQKRNSNELN